MTRQSAQAKLIELLRHEIVAEFGEETLRTAEAEANRCIQFSSGETEAIREWAYRGDRLERKLRHYGRLQIIKHYEGKQ